MAGWSTNLRDSPDSSPCPSPPQSAAPAGAAPSARVQSAAKTIEPTILSLEEHDLEQLIDEAAQEAVQEAEIKGSMIDIGGIKEGAVAEFVETPFTIAKRVAGTARRKREREEWERGIVTARRVKTKVIPAALSSPATISRPIEAAFTRQAEIAIVAPPPPARPHPSRVKPNKRATSKTLASQSSQTVPPSTPTSQSTLFAPARKTLPRFTPPSVVVPRSVKTSQNRVMVDTDWDFYEDREEDRTSSTDSTAFPNGQVSSPATSFSSMPGGSMQRKLSVIVVSDSSPSSSPSPPAAVRDPTRSGLSATRPRSNPSYQRNSIDSTEEAEHDPPRAKHMIAAAYTSKAFDSPPSHRRTSIASSSAIDTTRSPGKSTNYGWSTLDVSRRNAIARPATSASSFQASPPFRHPNLFQHRPISHSSHHRHSSALSPSSRAHPRISSSSFAATASSPSPNFLTSNPISLPNNRRLTLFTPTESLSAFKDRLSHGASASGSGSNEGKIAKEQGGAAKDRLTVLLPSVTKRPSRWNA